MRLEFSCNIQMVVSKFGVEHHESMAPSCLLSTLQAAGGIMVWGGFLPTQPPDLSLSECLSEVMEQEIHMMDAHLTNLQQ